MHLPVHRCRAACFDGPAGPQVGFESACDVSADISGVSESVECNADALGENTLDTKSTDVSLVFGGGLLFRLP